MGKEIKKFASDEEAFAALENAAQSDLTPLTAPFFKAGQDESVNVKVVGTEEFEGEFGKQEAIVVMSKGGIKFLAPQVVIKSSIDDMVKAKKVAFPFFARITGGGMITPKNGGKAYQDFSVAAL